MSPTARWADKASSNQGMPRGVAEAQGGDAEMRLGEGGVRAIPGGAKRPEGFFLEKQGPREVARILRHGSEDAERVRDAPRVTDFAPEFSAFVQIWYRPSVVALPVGQHDQSEQRPRS